VRQLGPAAERADAERTPPDGFAEDVLLKMANLDEEDTHVPGTNFISTALGSRGPRVK
jgi:hypothetical protein